MLTVHRYIDGCDRIKDTADGPELDKLIGELDDLYRAMTEDERRAVDAHFEAREPG